MNPLHIAVAMPSPPSPMPNLMEAEPREDDSVKRDSHADGILGSTSGGQPGLPSVQQLLTLTVKQITSFLG